MSRTNRRIFLCGLLTADVDNANSRRLPHELVDRILGFDRYLRSLDLVRIQRESHGTVKYGEVFNVSCGNNTRV